MRPVDAASGHHAENRINYSFFSSLERVPFNASSFGLLSNFILYFVLFSYIGSDIMYQLTSKIKFTYQGTERHLNLDQIDT